MTELEHLELALLAVKGRRDINILTNGELLDLIIDEIAHRNYLRQDRNVTLLQELK